jgi:O-antigen ligase
MARWLDRLEWGGWGLFLILLPFTSQPLAAKILRSSMVAPASGVVLLGWVAFWLLPRLWKGAALPAHVLPLLGWLSVMVLSAGLAHFIPLPPYRFGSIWRGELEGIVTLGIGLCFYLVTATWVRDPERLRFSLRWINWSGVLILVYCAVQFAAMDHAQGTFPDWVWSLQAWFSTARLPPARVTGMALEPSWLAHQLNVLYLPLWLSAALNGQSAHRLRLGPLTLERVLAVGGLAVLALSFSRIGLISALLMIALLALEGLRRFWGNIQPRWLGVRYTSARVRRWTTVGMYLVVILALVGLTAGVGWGLSRTDPRMARLFDVQALRDGSVLQYANQLLFAERLIYWEAGWEVFEQYPLLGVGPNNSGYFFTRTLNPYAWNLLEVSTIFYDLDNVPNPKNLWVRILAETGLAGFALFVTFLALIGLSARQLLRQADGLGQWLGLAGRLALAALLVEGFSLDTYALPYWWISFGLVTAAWWGWYNRKIINCSAD